jgi:hypothetical protein
MCSRLFLGLASFTGLVWLPLLAAGCGTEVARPGLMDRPPPCDIYFDVYSSGSFTNRLWTVSVNSQWCRVQHPPKSDPEWGTVDLSGLGDGSPSVAQHCWRYEIEDRGYLAEQTGNMAWADDYADIDIVVYFEKGRPVQVKSIQHKNSSGGYRYDMFLNGRKVVHNLDAHQGEVVDLRPPAPDSP